jgi:hypothetical protein
LQGVKEEARGGTVSVGSLGGACGGSAPRLGVHSRSYLPPVLPRPPQRASAFAVAGATVQ